MTPQTLPKSPQNGVQISDPPACFSTLAAHAAQDGPNGAKSVPKSSPRGPKIRPRRPQGGQKCHQGCQNDPQSVPQMAPMRSKVPPEGPERSKGSKKCQQDAPSSPKDQKSVTKNGQEAEQDQGCDPPRNTWPKDLKMRFPPLCTNEF